MSKVTTPPVHGATRSPVKDVMGDKHSLGMLVFEGSVLDKCRELSGEPRDYKKEYAIWYSTHDLIAYIGGQKLIISRPYAFYNTNQTAGAASVEWEHDDALLLHETYRELQDAYTKKYVDTDLVGPFYEKLISIVTKYYVLAKFNNDLAEFTDRARASLHVTAEQIESASAQVTDAVKQSNPDATHEHLDALIFNTSVDVVLDSMIKDGYTIDPKITDEQVHAEALYWATEQLKASGDIVGALPTEYSDEVVKDVVDNGKLAFALTNTSLHTLHAHPRGVNAFSGAAVQGSTPVINGTSGDLRNNYKETYNITTGEWDMDPNSELGIVYPWTGEGKPFPLPAYAGVVQQINKITTLAFNELRQWKINVEQGDYRYSRTPLLTYVTGHTPEVTETLPPLALMLGKELPKLDSEDYIVPYLGTDSTAMTEELFQVFLDNPIDVMYDIDADRVEENAVTSYYGYSTKSTYKKKYPTKKKMVAWILKQKEKLKELFSDKTVTGKSLGKLSAKKLQDIMDAIATSHMFASESKVTKSTLTEMNQVFNMFGKDLFDFATSYQDNYAYSSKVVEYFLDYANSPTLPQWERLSKAKVNFDDIVGKSRTEINLLLPTTYNTTTTTTKKKKHWPIMTVDLTSALIALGEAATGTYQMNMAKIKSYIFSLYSVPKAQESTLWKRMELFDVDFAEFLDPTTITHTESTISKLLSWELSDKDTTELLSTVDSYEDIISWTHTVDAVRLLLAVRRDGKTKFTKYKDTQNSFAKYLTTKHSKATVKVGGVTYGVYASNAKEETIKVFNELYLLDIAKIVPTGMSAQSAVNLLDKLEVSKTNFIENLKAKEILEHLAEFSDTDIDILSEYVAPYTDNPTYFLYYTSIELNRLNSESIEDVTIWTNSDINEKLGVTVSYAIELLTELNVEHYKTTIGTAETKVSINSTNATLALTDLVLEYLCTGLSREDATKVIKTINLIMADAQELLVAPESNGYVQALINFNLTEEEVNELQSNGTSWKDILTASTNKKKYTGLPYKQTINGYDLFFAPINNRDISITKAEYRKLCSELCVISSLTTGDQGSIATTTSGFRIRIKDVNKYTIGDICYPVVAK